jgi:hypothetical protein
VTSLSEAGQASRDCTEQRLLFLPLLRMDVTKAPTSAQDGCRKAHAASIAEPVKFDAMLTHPAVAKLFACGALFFAAPETP